MAILTLPTEVLIEIFAGVPHVTDILTCRCVCHVFRNVIKTSIRLNYRIELERAGMIDNPRCKLSANTRLEMLRERERSWGHFDWKFVTTNLKVPSTSSPLYMVTPSAVVLGLELPGEEFGTTGFQSIKLPCTEGEVVSEAWNTVDVKEKVLDFGTSIEEHDLLAYVTCSEIANELSSAPQLYLVLRHHSDPLKPHEEASIPRIPICAFNANQADHVVSVEIAGANVATTVALSSNEDAKWILYVFDWKTGIIKTSCRLLSSCSNPVFLREDILLFPTTASHFLVYFIPPSSSTSSCTRLVLVLGIPTLSRSQYFDSSESQCSPSPTQDSMFPRAFSQERPFLNDPMAATVVFTFTIEKLELDISGDHFAMVVHRKALLDLVLPYALLDGDGSATPFIQWESWGPPVTRWLRVDEFSRDFRMHSSGQRYVQHIEPDEHGEEHGDTAEPPRSITIFDFNPWNVQYVRLHKERILAARRNHLDGFEIEVVGEDSSCQQQEKSSETVEPENQKAVSMSQVISEHSSGVHGRLPYVRYSSTKWPAYDAVFMDEERLIGINTEDDTYGITSMDVIYFG